MSLTNWKTWASNDVLTASDMNVYVRDNGRWLSSNATSGRPIARVYASSAQNSFTANSAIAFDTDDFDVQAMHDPVTNNSRLTIPSSSDGKYLVGCTARTTYTYDGSGTADIRLELRVNGSSNFRGTDRNNGFNYSGVFVLNFTEIQSLSAEDYCEAFIDHSNATSLDINADVGKMPDFWACWVGE